MVVKSHDGAQYPISRGEGRGERAASGESNRGVMIIDGVYR